MVPAPLRCSIYRLLPIVLLVAPLTIPSIAGAQLAPHGAVSASGPTLVEPALAGPMVAAPMVAGSDAGSVIVTDPATTTITSTAATAAPPFAAAAVAGVHTTMMPADALARAESVAPAALARRASSGLQQSQVLMIVGGASVLLGLVTDGAASDLLLIGGAVVGLYGLYRYLQ